MGVFLSEREGWVLDICQERGCASGHGIGEKCLKGRGARRRRRVYLHEQTVRWLKEARAHRGRIGTHRFGDFVTPKWDSRGKRL